MLQYRLTLALLFCVNAFACSCTVFAMQEDAKEFSTAKNDADLAKYFAAETKKISDDCLNDINSIDEWNSKKQELRGQLFEMLGLSPLPQKTDLQVVYTGETEHEEFVVRKLHFQSRPGLYVTGNLYVPKKVKKKLPAILYVCGHGRVNIDGVSYGNKVHYQHHGSWFARNGYVCLTIDTLQLGEIEGIHHGTYREKMWWWLNRGYTPAGVEAWNCIRAIDLLQSLPEVDAKRIGVTGRSGGGAYSWWIAAIDERIKCAVPVAGLTDMKNHVVDGCIGGHCDCMFMVNTHRWDYPMVAALVAPRPLLISNTDSDGIFPLDGVYRTFNKVRKIYRLHNAADQLALNITAGPHKDTQELRMHAFRWFNHHMKNDDSLISKPAEKFLEPKQLKVFETLPANQRNSKIHETFVDTADVKRPSSHAEWQQWCTEWKTQLKEQTFRGWPIDGSPVKPIQLSESKLLIAQQTITRVDYQFESQKHVPLTFTVLKNDRVKSIQRYQMMIVTDDSWIGMNQWLKTGYRNSDKGPQLDILKQLLRQDSTAIVIFTPRGVGKNRWNQESKANTQIQRRFYLLGQTADAMRVYDIIRCISSLKSLASDDIDVLVSAEKSAAILSAYAAIFEPAISRLYLFNPPASHRSGPFLLNVRKIIDIPQAIALAAETTSIELSTSDAKPFRFLSELETAIGKQTGVELKTK